MLADSPDGAPSVPLRGGVEGDRGSGSNKRVERVRDQESRATGSRDRPCIGAASAADVGEPTQLAQQEIHIPVDQGCETEGRQTVPARGDHEVLDGRTPVPQQAADPLDQLGCGARDNLEPGKRGEGGVRGTWWG